MIRHGMIFLTVLMSALTLQATERDETRVLCTTFPVYQITRNVTLDSPGVTVELLLPASLGCPHHYALTPRDMRRLGEADVLVVNGLGLEEFLGAPLQRANPRLVVIDSSKGLRDIMHYSEDTHGARRMCDGNHEKHACAGGDCRHEGGAVNPHLFASPRMAGKQAERIAAGLSATDPEGAEVYAANAQAYAERMGELAGDMAALVKTFENNRIVQPHGIFDYLARDIGLDIVAVTQPHGLEPSAADMLKLVQRVRDARPAVVFTEPQYSPKVGRIIARETGIPVVMIDPVASGPDDAPLDYYERVMRSNMERMRRVFAPHPRPSP